MSQQAWRVRSWGTVGGGSQFNKSNKSYDPQRGLSMTYYQDWPCELGVTIRTNITRRCQQSQDKWEDSGGRDLKLQLYLITLYVIRTWVVFSINNITILVGPVPSTWVALWSWQEDATTVVVWLGCRSTTRLAILGIFPNYSRGDRGMLVATTTILMEPR